MPCLTEEQLDALAAGELSDTAAKPLRAHLEECRQCRQIFDECRENHPFAADLRVWLADGGSPEVIRPVSLSGPLPDAENSGSSPLPSIDGIPGYELVREIHRGGQGVVYEAVQLSTNRTVAVKVMLEGPFVSERARWRFEREVKLIARLRHPNIVVIHDSGIAQKRYYFAMDYVRGEPLDTHIRLSALPTREIVRIFLQVCDAVSCAHRHGVIHRDLKPSNILVGDDGRPQVLDFGLAKTADEQREGSGRPLVTMPGQILGTIRYMSPEQARGDPEAVDTRTDVYSLGVILYEALTRAAPYPTNLELASALRNIQEMDPSRPSRLCREVNSELDAIVLKAMHKDPDRRYASAAELGEDLKAWLEGRPVSAKSDSSLYVLRKLASRHRFETSVVVALIVAVLSIAGISFEFYRRERVASRDLEQANRIIGEKYTQLQNEQQEVAAGAQRAIGAYVLGWFLLEYHAGRSDRARTIMDQTAKTDPAYAAMAFLMDENYPVEQLRSALPADSADLLQFVVGERAFKGGRLSEARQAFSRCSESPGGEWLKSAARARLQQLSLLSGASAASGPS